MATTLGKANALRYRGYVYDPETALYYLQSRYYNPGTGRFINADVLASTGQGLLGNNMFSYCGNNPITRVDLTGLSWREFWENVKEWLEEKKEDAETNADGTVTIGITGNAALGAAASGAAGYTFDAKGNVGKIYTGNGGAGFPSAGAGGYIAINNAPTIYHQKGLGMTIGASGGPWIVAIGGEYNMLVDQENKCAYHGGTFSVTYGFYPTVVELHGEAGKSFVDGFNVYDKAIEIVDWILRW